MTNFPNKLVSKRQLREVCGIPYSFAHIARLEAAGRFPKRIKLGACRVAWRVSEIERALTAFARSSNGGLIVAGSALAAVQRNLIIELAARHRLPAVYFERHFVTSGGLISYGANQVDGYRRAAGYVDRILRGEKPADLPVQAPTKYELVINLKTAKAIGLTIPPTVLARADEVIE